MDGCYSLPSGHIEPKETVVEAAVREAEEELGVWLMHLEPCTLQTLGNPTPDLGPF